MTVFHVAVTVGITHLYEPNFCDLVIMWFDLHVPYMSASFQILSALKENKKMHPVGLVVKIHTGPAV